MKRTLTLVCVAFSLLLFSCKPDPCAELSCLNGGACLEGTCLCTEGYSGEDCETEIRSQFLGAYSVDEDCGSNPYSFSCSIFADSASVSRVVFSNFNNLDLIFGGNPPGRVYGEIDNGGLTIPAQQVGSITYSGSGVKQANGILFSYTVESQNPTVTCSGLFHN